MTWDSQTIIIAVVALALAYALYKRSRKKGGGSSGGSRKVSVTPVLPPVPKGYFSLALAKGKLWAGTYSLGGGVQLRSQGVAIPVPVRESVYHIDVQGDDLFLSCENAGGRLFVSNGKSVKQAWSGGLDSIICSKVLKGRRRVLSSDFTNHGAQFDTFGGAKIRLPNGENCFARDLIEFGSNFYILGFDYNAEVGGWWVSKDLSSWAWRPKLAGMRFLRAVTVPGKMIIAGSPFRGGGRVPPATILEWNGRQLKKVFEYPALAMFFGLDTNGKDVFAGGCTGWNAGGQGMLFKSDPWRPIWRCPEPEIPAIAVDGENVYVATRNNGGTGRVYRIVGEPGIGKAPVAGPVKSATTIGGGFVWKHISEGDGKLVILFPASWPTPSSVTVNGEAGRLATSSEHPDGRTNGNRPTFRFSKPGAAYGMNVKLVVDGQTYIVPNGGQRIG